MREIRVYSKSSEGACKLSENFRVREFACSDGSDPVFIDPELVTVLQAIALAVDDGVVVKGNLTMGGLKVTVGSKTNGNTFVKITQKQEDEREITRNGVK